MTSNAVLSAHDLTVTVGGVRLIDGVGLDVWSNGLTALLGRNGAGKTTTVRALLGLGAQGGRIEGTVELDGRRIDGLATHERVRAGIGYVPEDRAIFSSLNVGENLRLAEQPGTDPNYDRVFMLFPLLARRRRQLAGTLSGGEQQMLAIGRVLLGDTHVLVIDEPTKGLAPKVVAEVADALYQLARDLPVLLVEQNLTLVRSLAEQAVVLEHGRLAWSGRADKLLAQETLTRTLLGIA